MRTSEREFPAERMFDGVKRVFLKNKVLVQNKVFVLALVLALPEKYSTIIHLYYYEGYSIKEIADILRLPPATVGTRLARGRAQLRAALGADMDAPAKNPQRGDKS